LIFQLRNLLPFPHLKSFFLFVLLSPKAPIKAAISKPLVFSGHYSWSTRQEVDNEEYCSKQTLHFKYSLELPFWFSILFEATIFIVLVFLSSNLDLFIFQMLTYYFLSCLKVLSLFAQSCS